MILISNMGLLTRTCFAKKGLFPILAFLFLLFSPTLFAQNFKESSHQYLWVDAKGEKKGVAEYQIQQKGEKIQVEFFLWSPQSPSKNYRSQSLFALDSLLTLEQLYLADALKENYRQESYQRSTREWMNDGLGKHELLTLHKSPLFTEEQLLSLIPFLYERGIKTYPLWLQRTLSIQRVESREPVYSEIQLTEQKTWVKDVKCTVVKWIVENKEYVVYLSLEGWPKVLQINFPDLSRLELHKIEVIP